MVPAEEKPAHYRALGLPRFVGFVLFSLGNVARAEGDHVCAHRLFQEGLTTMIEVGESLAIPSALESFAHQAVDEGQAMRAARAAARLRDTSGTRSWPTVRRSRALAGGSAQGAR